MTARSRTITEKDLREDFDSVQREVAEQMQRFEQDYPELADRRRTGEEVIRQPVYQYEVHAVS